MAILLIMWIETHNQANENSPITRPLPTEMTPRAETQSVSKKKNQPPKLPLVRPWKWRFDLCLMNLCYLKGILIKSKKAKSSWLIFVVRPVMVNVLQYTDFDILPFFFETPFCFITWPPWQNFLRVISYFYTCFMKKFVHSILFYHYFRFLVALTV